MTDAATAARAESLRARVQALSDRQHDVERHLAQGLHVDHNGLMAMNRLVGEGPASPTELARALAVSPAAMSLVLQRLEDAGHVERAPHPSDRRRIVVTPTEPSSAAAMDLVTPLIAGIAEISAALSPDEQATVERFLDDLRALYERVSTSDPGR